MMGKTIAKPVSTVYEVKQNSKQSGQILLIVILAMVVALTVGLSVISHTVTNLKTSKQNEESQKAFQAAESGLDQALKQINSGDLTNGSLPGVTLDNSSNFQVSVNDTDSSSSKFTDVNNGDLISQDQGYDIWLSNYPDFSSPFNGSVSLFWDENASQNCVPINGSVDSDPTISPALEVIVLYSTTPPPTITPAIHKYVYDPCQTNSPRPIVNSTKPGQNSFDVGSYTLTENGKTYLDSATINSIQYGLLMKVVPIYNSTTMAIRSLGPDLPSQGKIIESKGTSGETVRKLQYFISYPQMPAEFMQYAIISQ